MFKIGFGLTLLLAVLKLKQASAKAALEALANFKRGEENEK